jgi:hypothetical protein
LILVLLAATSAVGCAPVTSESPFREGSNRPVPLEVVNNNMVDVRVYALGAGGRFRLGDVRGKSTESFRIDPRQVSLVSGLQLLVDPIGGRGSYTSPVVFPPRGTSVILTVGSDLGYSYISIR